MLTRGNPYTTVWNVTPVRCRGRYTASNKAMAAPGKGDLESGVDTIA